MLKKFFLKILRTISLLIIHTYVLESILEFNQYLFDLNLALIPTGSYAKF